MVSLTAISIYGVLDENIYKHADKQIELLEQISTDIPDIIGHEPSIQKEQPHADHFEQRIRPALRILHCFLKEADPSQYWDGLEKVVTEDGNIFWLCPEHAHPYQGYLYTSKHK